MRAPFPSAEQRSVAGVFAVLVALSVPALLDPGALARGAGLLHLAQSAQPYWPSEHVGLLYFWIPIVAASAMALMLAPGLILAFAAGGARSAAEWLLMGLAISVVMLSVVTEAVEAATGGPLRGSAFAAVAVATAAGAALVSLTLVRPDRVLRLARGDIHALAAALVGPLVLFVALEPKFLWESFNGDGAHAFESARLLLHQAVPFWSKEAGGMSSYPGVTSFLESYPMAWFIRLFGEIEAAARLPYLLFLSAGIYAGLLVLIETGRTTSAETRTRWFLWLGLAVFTVVMGFSASYDPYHADIALPATQDALVIAWFLGFAWAFMAERPFWMIGFAGLTYVTSPAGLVLLGLWLGAAAVFLRPLPLRTLAVAAGAMAMWFVLARISPAILAALGLPVPGAEHDTGTLAARLLHVQWRDWRRVAYFIIPGGILPALSVALVWRQDRVARTVAAVAAAQFAFFYFQSRVSLHYFAPGMVLPLAVFWRTAPFLWRGRGLSLAVAGAAALALFMSLPANPGPVLAARPVGAAIEDRLGGYDKAESGAFARAKLLNTLIPTDAHQSVPDSSYGGSPLAWFYYAHRTPGPRPVAYLFERESAPPPEHGRLAAARDGVALYVVDEAALARDRGRRPPTSIARIYRISKYTLFHGS